MLSTLMDTCLFVAHEKVDFGSEFYLVGLLQSWPIESIAPHEHCSIRGNGDWGMVITAQLSTGNML